MKNIFFIVAILFSYTLSAQVKSIKFKGEKRRYIIYLPKTYMKNTNEKFPIVFNFHGGGMTMAEQMLYTQMNKTADKNRFIVIYPQGIKQDWNVGFGMSYKYGIDDVGFIDSLINYTSKNYRIDSTKIFATGLSRGGFFCQRLASELPHKFSAIASVGGPLPDSVAYYKISKKEIGVLNIQGTEDQIVKLEGKENDYFSGQKTYEFWKTHNNLMTSKDKEILLNNNKNDSTSITIIESNNGNKYVSFIKIIGGGHTWSGADEFNIGLPIGRTSQELDLNEYIWAFFKKQKF